MFLLVVAWRVRRDEAALFSICIALCLVVTPIVWLNYFSLVLLAVAVFRPRSEWVWLLPVLFWLVPHAQAVGQLRWLLLWYAVLGGSIVIAWYYRDQRGQRSVINWRSVRTRLATTPAAPSRRTSSALQSRRST